MGDIPMSDADLLRWRDEELKIEQNANGKLADDAKFIRDTLDRVIKGRFCSTCAHGNRHPRNDTCSSCSRFHPNRWEPREAH